MATFSISIQPTANLLLDAILMMEKRTLSSFNIKEF
jgi:hypothetical protein